MLPARRGYRASRRRVVAAALAAHYRSGKRFKPQLDGCGYLAAISNAARPSPTCHGFSDQLAELISGN